MGIDYLLKITLVFFQNKIITNKLKQNFEWCAFLPWSGFKCNFLSCLEKLVCTILDWIQIDFWNALQLSILFTTSSLANSLCPSTALKQKISIFTYYLRP